MAERRSDSGKKDKGKGKVGEASNTDDDQTMAASQENQSDMVSPSKKRRTDDQPDAQRESSNAGDDEIPQENINAPSNTPDQVQRNALRPGSRYYPSEDYCVVKILNSYDVVPRDARLYLDVSDASTLAEDPDIIYHPPGAYSKNLMVFDADDRQYDMLLINYAGAGGGVHHCLAGDWDRFVRTHNLKAGDEITFYQIFDRRICDDYYYVIKYFRKPADRKFPVIQLGKGRGKPGDGDGGKDSGKYKLESRRKESGGLVIKLGKR